MERKTPEEIAEAIDQAYGDEPIGTELAEVLAKVIKAGKYEPAEIDRVKKEVGTHLTELRRLRRTS